MHLIHFLFSNELPRFLNLSKICTSIHVSAYLFCFGLDKMKDTDGKWNEGDCVMNEPMWTGASVWGIIWCAWWAHQEVSDSQAISAGA